ncbi:MAG: hypothetical protein HY960_12315 [Ignavibacteriae bacterium]|nr:hypothetical protein [Ignavibacteriota bacterium]
MQKCIVYLLIVMLLITGCTHTQVFSPEHLENDSGESITVFLKDGRIIRFRSGDYTVVNVGNEMIRGTGKLVINKQTGEFLEFVGTINFDEIEKVTITETTLAGKITLVLVVSGLALFGLLMLLLSNLLFKT